jgi:1-aminocyclopropane-1-carboxylate deaminase
MDSNQFPFNLPSRVDELSSLYMGLSIKRDDLIHPIVSGNKWRKLEGFFKTISPQMPIITYGGAYSNHLPAAAFASKLLGHPITGVVRGDELNHKSNPLLAYCHNQGMRLEFVSRSDYRKLREHQINESEAEILPEGGAGPHALEGCGNIWRELEESPDHLVLASGTATTAFGIMDAMPKHASTKMHVISAVKGARLEEEMLVKKAQEKELKLHWEDEVHYGGFGKWNEQLMREQEKFQSEAGIQIDLNYNAKVWAYLKRNRLSGKVLWIHTGGIRF